MADDPTADPDKTVQLTASTSAAEPKLAVVRPGPRAVTVKVPAATPVAREDTTDTEEPVEATTDDVSDVIKKNVLLDEIVAATGVKRSDAKSVSEALFAALATHLSAGRSLQLPPLGKLRVVNEKEVGQGAKALTVKIRTPNPD